MLELKDEAWKEMKMINKNSKKDVEKVIKNLESFASNMESSNKKYSNKMID